MSFIIYIGQQLTKSNYDYIIESHLILLVDELRFKSENFYGNLLLGEALVQQKIHKNRYNYFLKFKI